MARFKRSKVARIAGAAILAAALTVAGRARALIHNGALDTTEAIATEQTIQVVRDLHLSRPVDFAVMKPDEVAAMLAKPRRGDRGDELLAAEGEAGAMLGLFARGTDLKSASIRALRSQLLAFYDFDSKKLVVVDGASINAAEAASERAGRRDLVGYMILAHELTHALQDQNFGLGDAMNRLRGDSDRELALRAVAEGDATLAGWGYATGKMDQGTVATLDRHLGDATRGLAARPAADSVAAYEYLNFPYLQGMRFVGEAYRRGGWAAVDALYSNPPQSTQQIIDPSLYFDHPALPAWITVTGYERILFGWSEIGRNSYGEIGLQVILRRNLGIKSDDVGLARRWAGDRMVLLRRGDALAVLWIIAFRDNASARRFATLYDGVLGRVDGREMPHRVATMASAAIVVVGDPARTATLIPAISRASTIAPQPPALP